jgi:hypothetical protein
MVREPSARFTQAKSAPARRYAALRTVPPSGNSYVSPCPGSYVSRAPVGDATLFRS